MVAPYNPLDKANLALSVANALLGAPVAPLGDTSKAVGAGVYALYYTGDFPAYAAVSSRNRDGRFECPIYVGKAVPAGSRKGLLELNVASSTALRVRLDDHADSIRWAVSTLRIEDFWFRSLVVDDIWIPLGESVLIRTFQPLWNHALDGFGNHDPGSGRYEGRKSSWDELHPGRPWATKLKGASRFTVEEIIARLSSIF